MSLQPNFEYKVEILDHEDLDEMEKRLNILGREAWEMVSFDGETGIFKRRQLSLVEPYTGNGTHKELPKRLRSSQLEHISHRT